jgi:hypothetical protein
MEGKNMDSDEVGTTLCLQHYDELDTYYNNTESILTDYIDMMKSTTDDVEDINFEDVFVFCKFGEPEDVYVKVDQLRFEL